jgi:hypothetical protein
MNILIGLFIASAVAHIISYQKLRQVKAPHALGVLAFVFINFIIAFLLWQEFDWSKWLALIFPAVGGLGLLATTILKGKATRIDYVILIFDIAIVGWVLKYYIV